MHLTSDTNDTKRSQDMRRLITGIVAFAVGLIGTIAMSGCLAAAAGGVGYAIGHEQGEDHITEGKHGDDD
ncbi:MAG: hypothetical protein JJ974_11665 [Phycisphaerales bacterium]|nr:hypothetical protein [Phycisphaerales bacterium]